MSGQQSELVELLGAVRSALQDVYDQMARAQEEVSALSRQADEAFASVDSAIREATKESFTLIEQTEERLETSIRSAKDEVLMLSDFHFRRLYDRIPEQVDPTTAEAANLVMSRLRERGVSAPPEAVLEMGRILAETMRAQAQQPADDDGGQTWLMPED